MDTIRGFIDSLLQVEFQDITSLLDSTINNPLANLQASLLVLAAVVVLTLLAVVAAIMLLGFTDDDDEDEEDEEGVSPEVVEAPKTPKPKVPPVPFTPEQKRFRRAQSVLFGTVAFVLLWLALGLTTGSEVMCLSCHESDMPHPERLAEEATTDPHTSVTCVRCHEPGGTAANLTYDVPLRVTHFVLAMAAPRTAVGYGTPIVASSCSSCHSTVGDRTVTVETRGIRISHKEPLDAGATCIDCHEMQVTSGAVGPWTVGMTACMRCHDNEQVSAECTFCHTRDIAYAVHVNRVPEPKRLVEDKRCYTCHDKKACDSCHGVTMPHSEAFFVSEHPYQATLDNWYNGGRRCGKCHTDKRNPCSRCHDKGPFPGHPIGIWPRIHGNRPEAGFDSCDSCHGGMALIEGRNFCGVCHERYKGYR